MFYRLLVQLLDTKIESSMTNKLLRVKKGERYDRLSRLLVGVRIKLDTHDHKRDHPVIRMTPLHRRGMEIHKILRKKVWRRNTRNTLGASDGRRVWRKFREAEQRGVRSPVYAGSRGKGRDEKTD